MTSGIFGSPVFIYLCQSNNFAFIILRPVNGNLKGDLMDKQKLILISFLSQF